MHSETLPLRKGGRKEEGEGKGERWKKRRGRKEKKKQRERKAMCILFCNLHLSPNPRNCLLQTYSLGEPVGHMLFLASNKNSGRKQKKKKKKTQTILQ